MSLLQIQNFELGSLRKYYGKYRGVVVENVDPKNMARIIAIVPDVSSLSISSWAMPCLPWAGPGAGMVCVPPLGAGVWIEFEYGDPDRPIWTGCYWGSPAEVPLAASAVVPGTGVTFQTLGQNLVQFDELGIRLKTRFASVEINDANITIQHLPMAKVVVSVNTVDINSGALQVI